MTPRSQNRSGAFPRIVYRETKRGIFRRGGEFVLHCEDVALPKLASGMARLSTSIRRP